MSESERESRVGSRIGHYHLMRLLGKGGMGEVYEAEDIVKDRIVALKLLPESVSDDPVFRKRLQREAHSAGRLQEPHVVPIHDYGEIDGLLYVDMRMINGTDLRKMLKRFGPIAPARAVAIVRQVASALDAAHEAGVIHRDVKPENILITRDDFVYLVDFGIANAATDEKLTELGTAVGTYAYMAPERFTNDEVTYRADIYALACVLHECLVGSQPYPGDSVSVVITAHLMGPTPRPSEMRPGIPKAFDDVIARGMAKKPDDRYASAGDLAQAANDALTSRDQDQAATILERSTAATLPGQTATAVSPSSGPAPPTLPATPAPTPRPAPPTPPHVAAHTPPSEARPPAAFYTPPPRRQSGAAWTAPPSGPLPRATPRKRNLWIPVAAAGGVFAVALGGLGIWWAVKPEPSAPAMPTTRTTTESTETTTRTTRTSPPPDRDSFDAKLLGLLPRDYSDTACEMVHPPAPGALATVDCGSTQTAGASTAARYSLYADLATLNQQFQQAIEADSQLLQCPGGSVDSPTTWHYNATPNKVEGQLACGIYNNKPNLAWTHESELLLGAAQGSNHDDLHKWWSKYA
jgi:serine/threonine kinase PknH